MRLGVGDYISQEAHEQAPKLFPRVPHVSALQSDLPSGVEDFGPRWRQERAVSVCAVFAWKAFVEPSPGTGFLSHAWGVGAMIFLRAQSLQRLPLDGVVEGQCLGVEKCRVLCLRAAAEV